MRHRNAAALTLVLILTAQLRAPAQGATPRRRRRTAGARRRVRHRKRTPARRAITVDNKIRVLSLPDGRELRAIDLPAGPGDVFSSRPMADSSSSATTRATCTCGRPPAGFTQCELHLRRYPGVGCSRTTAAPWRSPHKETPCSSSTSPGARRASRLHRRSVG